MTDSAPRILLVDDDPDIRAIGAMSLGRLGGFDVVQARSGTHALEVVLDARPDIILLDVMMPGMDGRETLKRLRELEALRDVPILFLTAKVQPQEVEEYLALGAAGVVPKPFDPMTLPDRVREVLPR